MKKNVTTLLPLVLAAVAFTAIQQASASDPKTWNVIATKNQEFAVEGQKKPVITVKAGEDVHLRITAEKGTVMAKDGSVHSFTIKALADQGWSVRLKPGTQEFTLKAPSKPGEYVIECTVLCGPHHLDQRMKLVVIP